MSRGDWAGISFQIGVNGLLVDNAGDPGELAEKILALLQDAGLRERLARSARRRVLARFTWERIAREQEAVYDGILRP